MNELFMISGMALVTYGIRFFLLPASGGSEIPPALARALRYVPPAVLTAIIVPAVIIPDGATVMFNWHNPHLAGALAACAAGWASGNLLLTIVAGMAGFWLWPVILHVF